MSETDSPPIRAEDAAAASSLDPLFAEAARFAAGRDDVSTTALAKHFALDKERAERLLNQLAEQGVLRPGHGEGRTVLLQDANKVEQLLTVLELVEPAQDCRSHRLNNIGTQSGHYEGTDSDNVEDTGAEGGDTEGGTDCDVVKANGQDVRAVDLDEVDTGDEASEPYDIKLKASVKADVAVECQHPLLACLRLNDLEIDQGVQCRTKTNNRQVSEYAESMQRGDRFPAIKVVRIGGRNVVVDGFHRVAAAISAGLKDVQAEVHEGDERTARLMAAMANTAHGIRRSNADKRRAVERLLRDDEWRNKTDRDIARAVAVDHKTLGTIRKQLEATGEIPQSPIRETADGRVMDTSGLSARAKPKPSEAAKVITTTNSATVVKHAGDDEQDRSATTERADVQRAVAQQDDAVATDPHTADTVADEQAGLTDWLDDLDVVVSRGLNADVGDLVGDDVEAFGKRLSELITKLETVAQRAAGMSAS